MQSSPGLDHVKTPITYFKNLMSYFESSLYAKQRSYKNHDDALHTSRVTAPQTCRERERALDINKFSPIFFTFQVQ